MWLITNFGFFSVVSKPDDAEGQTVTVRARVKADLLALRENYIPSLGPILEHAGTDYRYRAKVPRSDLAIALLHIGLDIDYSNFKNSVAERQGAARSHLYHKVWKDLYQLQKSEPEVVPGAVSKQSKASGPTSATNVSYGGVLFDGRGRVLLRKPTGEFDNYVWTFPKGRGKRGTTPEQTAIREVLEETGYRAEIIGRVPGSFEGGTGTNEYFVMHPIADRVPFDPLETEAVEWVSYSDAVEYIKKTRNPIGRDRDLAVLRAAIVAYEKAGGNSADGVEGG